MALITLKIFLTSAMVEVKTVRGFTEPVTDKLYELSEEEDRAYLAEIIGDYSFENTHDFYVVNQWANSMSMLQERVSREDFLEYYFMLCS